MKVEVQQGDGGVVLEQLSNEGKVVISAARLESAAGAAFLIPIGDLQRGTSILVGNPNSAPVALVARYGNGGDEDAGIVPVKGAVSRHGPAVGPSHAAVPLRLKGAVARRRLLAAALGVVAAAILARSLAVLFARRWSQVAPVAVALLGTLILLLLGLAVYLMLVRLRFGSPVLLLDGPVVFGETLSGTLYLSRSLPTGSVLVLTLDSELTAQKLRFSWAYLGLELQRDRLRLWHEEKVIDPEALAHDGTGAVPISFRLPSPKIPSPGLPRHWRMRRFGGPGLPWVPVHYASRASPPAGRMVDGNGIFK